MAEKELDHACEALLIGGSAGSLEVLIKVLPLLEISISFAIVIIVHRKNSNDSALLELLSTKTLIPVREVEDKDAMQPGFIYLAPADYHLLIENERTFSLDDSEKVNFSRPSIDVTFESFADSMGNSTVAVILSGANTDGTQGLEAVHRAGGKTVAQDPVSAQVPFMPQHAITHTTVDYVFSTSELAQFINSLSR